MSNEKFDNKKTEREEAQAESIHIEGNMIFIMNPEVTIREEIEEDGRYVLFNAENEFILLINPTGKYILENCTGDKTVNQIVQNIKSEFTVNDDVDLEVVVKDYLTNSLKAELVKIKGGSESL
jgi:hypothetical protein